MRHSSKFLALLMFLCLTISIYFLLFATLITERLPKLDMNTKFTRSKNAGTEQGRTDILLPFEKFGNMEIVTGENLSVLVGKFTSRLVEISTATMHKKSTNNKTEVLHASKTVPVIAEYDKYFEKLAKYPEIQTILLSAPEENLPEILPTVQFYNYSTRNCLALHEKYQDKYGASCTDHLEMTLNPVNWRKRLGIGLHVGMPPGDIHVAKEKPILTYIHIGSDGIIHTNGIVHFHNVTVVPQGCNHNKHWKISYNDKTLKEYDEVFVASQSWGHNFYHNMLEILPRISSAVKFLQQKPEVKIHVLRYNEDLYTMLGLPHSHKRVVWGTVKAKVVYIPAGTPCGHPAIYNTQLLHLMLSHNLPQLPVPQRDLIILIQRTKDPKRSFKNHDTILQMLVNITKGTALKVEVFSDSSLPPLGKAAEMFNRAFLVVAPHGSGEANMLFSQPGSILVEGLCNPYKPNLCFQAMAQAIGLRYYGVYDPKTDCQFHTPEHFHEVVSFYIRHRHSL